ncbi:hypothetical protein [Lysobacter enzymogenes]|uniref:hypothetical protein n=1 Tax=Lysobacter enzymogenes TaxID=69 RepID=UPI00089BDD94|nr:hypothetical protein [Lysobacter enzymogenes]SDY05724.1 hypothetical protein SAMN05421681_110102 [Lysobacter enzymogenes]
MRPYFARVVVALCFSMALAACAANRSVDASAGSPSARASQLSAASILRWPLEGQPGRDRLVAELHRSFAMRMFADQQYSGDGPLRLADGTVLSFAMIRGKSGAVDIGFELSSCFTAIEAAELAGATEQPGTQDAHGSDVGKWYRATANGMVVRFDTEPATYRCVKTVHIRPARVARP